jgi:hypothetical protein
MMSCMLRRTHCIRYHSCGIKLALLVTRFAVWQVGALYTPKKIIIVGPLAKIYL